MYLSRPPISPVNDKQLAKKPSVKLHRGAGNETTVMVKDNSVRHPVTQQWTKRYQNQQSVASPVPETKTTSGGLYTAGKRKLDNG